MASSLRYASCRSVPGYHTSRDILAPFNSRTCPQQRTSQKHLDEGVVINVLIAQLSESVSACLMLDDATGIEWITIGTLRTEGNSRTVFPHLADAAVIGRIQDYHDDQGLIQIALVHG